jgi:hypothetical protein
LIKPQVDVLHGHPDIELKTADLEAHALQAETHSTSNLYYRMEKSFDMPLIKMVAVKKNNK